MENYLIYNGCEVKLSRDKDVLNSLTDIANESNDMKADAMVSIHVNKFPEEKYNGVGTYYVDNGAFTQERTKLAQIVQKQAIKSDNWGDRGIFKLKPTDLKLLRLSERPCVLVECGFLSNDGDVKRLSDDKVLANLAQNIDNGILEFLKSK
jgi:N-acetylmuramoyl-L-alanine amidase